jgi:Rps23 Pro-64 3,4-dihydroxylase Tpa1-like proline 4-hydroxylase
MYINCFAPSENPYFHIDCCDEKDDNEVTFLYYPNETWDLDDGGETQFFINERIYGVAPIPNRLIYFNANILHRATSFRDRHRFSIALKYEK